jgi:hypothetical protein
MGALNNNKNQKTKLLQDPNSMYAVAALSTKALRYHRPSFGPSPVARPGANLTTFRSVPGCRADIVRKNASRDGILRASNRDA